MAPHHSATVLVAALALVVITGVVAVVGQLGQRDAREVSDAVRDYFQGIERRQLVDALNRLAPGQRAQWRDFVANQLGDRHRVSTVSVQAPSLLDQVLRGESRLPTEATIMLEVNPGAPDSWRATTRVPLTRLDGRWLMVEPPLRPAASDDG